MADQGLSRTLNQKFDTVFEEVTHQETLNLLNRNDLKLFCLDIETNQFNFDPLVEFLEVNLGSMCFRELSFMSWWMPEKTGRSHLRQ